MKLIQYISTTYVREELYNPDNWDLINPKSPPEFISSGGPFCHKVELEGFEPSSKRGNHKLSTCLSLPKFFVQEQNQSHQFLPYPLKFHQKRKATSDYPRCNCTTKPECFGATASEWCLVLAPGAWIKLIYYDSIKQQEHNFRCQIKFWKLGL